ncbi:MAG: DUF7309 domain-containing protein, partial [Pseudomonadota bacterium]
MARRKPAIPSPSAKPDRFFEKQLAGEEPPTLATMETLYHLAVELYGREPWALLSDAQLVMTRAEEIQELCFCSILGALGQVFALQAYIGLEGYRFYRRMASREIADAAGFLASQHGVSVEFVRLKELTPVDRAMLRALRHPFQRGTYAPQFRSLRPGFHPWYITESEGRLLIECLRAVATLVDVVRERPGTSFWEREDAYPLVIRKPKEGHPHQYEIQIATPPALPEILPKLPALDEDRIRRIKSRRLPVKGVLDLDHFYDVTRIG